MNLHNRPISNKGAALILVLSLVVIMVGLVLTVFVAASGERRAVGTELHSAKARQLASSAPHFVISQIQEATKSGNVWASQPGMIRTYAPEGQAAGVYKLYSAERVFAPGPAEAGEELVVFDEQEDAPPSNWNAGVNSALYCDINQPTTDSFGSLKYPVADPSLAATSFTDSPAGAVPGFQIQQTATPGYSPGTPTSPENNPLPMPVRWIYILKDGQMTVPESVNEQGQILFSQNAAQPTDSNPVVGRMAFWTDDDTSKVNINTAGYARNDATEWTFWSTPVANARDENYWLAWAQPWTAEYQRYPGHPATTGLNVVFDSLNLTAEQTLSLTPRFKAGGTQGGTVRVTDPPGPGDIAAMLKEERLYATVDEMFYDPDRGANAAGISKEDLEARRFFLTAHSRAPEITLWNTPRVTIWPTWRQELAERRTPIDRLIAFCSTLGGQPFYFVRENPLSSQELLDIPQNLALWNYLRYLSDTPVPGFGGTFAEKYGAADRNQILTSIFDAIRLANLDDRSGGSSTRWSFTAGQLPPTGTYTAGYVAPSEGPEGTRAAGRAPALAEVAFLFARPNRHETPDANGVREIDKVKAAVLYGFFVPSAGYVQPGQNRRIVVRGLSSFAVRLPDPDPDIGWQQLFLNDVYDRTEIDSDEVSRRELGGRIEWTISQMSHPPTTDPADAANLWLGPPTASVVLPFDAANPNSIFEFSGGTLSIEVYSPANSLDPFQTYEITFPPANALTPLVTPISHPDIDNFAGWKSAQRWTHALYGMFEERMSYRGDTVLAMQSQTGDFRSEILRTDNPISDFEPHFRYGSTDILNSPLRHGFSAEEISRRASSLKWAISYAGAAEHTPQEDLFSRIFGRLIKDFDAYSFLNSPVIPSHHFPQSIQERFPPGDFSTGPGPAMDGSISPKTDEGAEVRVMGGTSLDSSPYFRNVMEVTRKIVQETLASPNRQMSSAVYFGSIPTGAPWRTLLFRPARDFHMGGTEHFGATPPPDYFMLDWFHMPVVEPYAISEPFSTAGKINLNSRIMPFGNYLRRETALHALLRSSRLTALPDSLAGASLQSRHLSVSNSPMVPTRHPINVEETLRLLRQRFDSTDGSNKRVYLTNAEICSVDIVPQGVTASGLANFWADKRITGDNLREEAYATILPRLTAKSNTYTVHVTAQALHSTEPDGGWREGTGKIEAEWRGAFSIERYIDPEDARFQGTGAPDFLSVDTSVEDYYRFRILGEQRFAP